MRQSAWHCPDCGGLGRISFVRIRDLRHGALAGDLGLKHNFCVFFTSIACVNSVLSRIFVSFQLVTLAIAIQTVHPIQRVANDSKGFKWSIRQIL